jgi:hypothetical protein
MIRFVTIALAACFQLGIFVGAVVGYLLSLPEVIICAWGGIVVSVEGNPLACSGLLFEWRLSNNGLIANQIEFTQLVERNGDLGLNNLPSYYVIL